MSPHFRPSPRPSEPNPEGDVGQDLVQRMRQRAQGLGAAPVALADVAEAHGPAARGMLLVLLSVPCLLPLPGAGTVLSLGLAALALALWRSPDGLRLPGRVARLELSSDSARRLFQSLAWVYEQAARLACQRLDRMVHWAESGRRLWLAPLVALMALLIFLPIPFGNVLPALALALTGLGLMFRDGLGVLLGAVFASLSVLFAGGLGWMAWRLAGHWVGF